MRPVVEATESNDEPTPTGTIEFVSAERSAGRPQHQSWSDFSKFYINGRLAAKCKMCQRTIHNTARARLEMHRNICLSKARGADGPTPFESDALASEEGSSTAGDPVACENEHIDIALAKFFSQNVPFGHVESKSFRTFIRELRPDYTPPSTQRLSKELIDRTFDTMVKEHEEKLQQSKSSVLLIDHWDLGNSKDASLAAMMYVPGEHKIFLTMSFLGGDVPEEIAHVVSEPSS